MKSLFNVIGIIMLPIGAVWLLQGMNVIRVGFMAGHRRWILAGGLLLLLGIVVLVFNNRKSRAT